MNDTQAWLEDAILCGDPARAAGLVLPIPLEHRDAEFGPLLARITAVLCDYPEEVHAALRLVCAICTDDAFTAAIDLGEQAVALIDHKIIQLSLADRFSSWIAELIWQLSDDVRDYTDHRLVIIETLCGEWQLPRPGARTYLFALAGALGAADAASGDGALARLLAADPGMCALIPSLLAETGAGRVLAGGTWHRAIASASAAGLIDRDSLLDLVLAPRSDEPSEDMHWYAELHEELAPRNEEMVARADAYLRLVTDPRPEVVSVVLALLFRRDKTTPLPVELLAGITSALVTASDPQHGLQLLERIPSMVRMRPDLAGPLAVAAGDAVSNENRYLVERSVATILVLLSLAGRSALKKIAEPLRHACKNLPEAQAGPILAALPPSATGTGTGTAASPPVAAAVEAAPSVEDRPARSRHRHRGAQRSAELSTQLPQPVRSAASLLQICQDFLASNDPMLGEFVLDGMAVLAGGDLAGIRAALAPLAGELEVVASTALSGDAARWLGERPVLGMMAILGLPETSALHGISWRIPSGPIGVLTLRTQEVLTRVQAGQGQQLLSLPTELTGAIDPRELAHRVARLAENGGAAWPMDIEQALLRANSPIVDPGVFVALSGVGSPVARTIERGLRQDLAARPAIGIEWTLGRPTATASSFYRVGEGTLSRHAMDIAACLDAGEGTALPVLLALPRHREMAAAHLVGPLSAHRGRPAVEDLKALALLGAASGRTHVATNLALLYGAALPDPEDRRAAVSALTALSTQGFDAEGCAQTWREALRADDRIDLRALAATLRELALAPNGQRSCRLLAQAAIATIVTPRAGLDEVRAVVESSQEPFVASSWVPAQVNRTSMGVG